MKKVLIFFFLSFQHHYKTAVFWADKVVSLSSGAPVDVYWLAQSYYLTKQYHRAILLINTYKLHRVSTVVSLLFVDVKTKCS